MRRDAIYMRERKQSVVSELWQSRCHSGELTGAAALSSKFLST